MTSKYLISGVKPTGESVHLGNLMGMMYPFMEAAQGQDATVFVADLHALTSVRNGDNMRKRIREVATTYLSVYGLDTPIRMFVQSDIVLLPKLHWILSSVTPYSLMLRAHSFKDAQAKNSDINMGTFTYPILMAADIIGYDNDLVPVGRDQQQHLEFARDIAGYFNSEYGEDCFKLPEAYIVDSVATLPGIDGRKMSKSYDNFIGVFDTPALLKKRVMAIKTDSTPVADPKDPNTCNVVALLRVFAQKETVAYVEEKYKSGNYGYGEAKLVLLEALENFLSPLRANREALEKHENELDKRLAEGAKIMNERMNETMERVSRLTGVRI